MGITVGNSVESVNDLVGAYDSLVGAWNGIPNRNADDHGPIIDAISGGAAALGALAQRLPPGWSQAAGAGGVIGSGAAFLKSFVDLQDAMQRGNAYDIAKNFLGAAAAATGFLAAVLPPPARYTAAIASIALTAAKNGFPSDVSIPLQPRNPTIDVDAAIAAGLIDRNTLLPTIAPETHTCTANSINWQPPRDPLVLDLDGGGITTSGINPASPIYFDQDADGVKTATGWIASGEAIVVRDLNGNGLIDSGRELFGDNTILTRGARAGQLAANGFEALADLDSDINGVADGKFDAADTAFASVKLWKDANQNGISETAELFTFAQLGVASINVAGTASNVNLGGGNTQTVTGSFTRTAGTEGEAGTAHLAGSLLLANNNFYRQFTDDPVLTTAAQALPQMRGSGAVRDLRPALSLGTAQAASLQTALGQFASGTTKAQQLSQLDAVIQSWGATSGMQTSVQTNRTLTIPVSGAGSVTAIAQFAQSNPALYAQITALERFNGQTILDKWVRASGATNAVSFSAEQQALLQQAYDALKNSVYGALVVQTRLKPYLGSKPMKCYRVNSCLRNILLGQKHIQISTHDPPHHHADKS